MPNPYDQFTPQTGANPYDQFAKPAAKEEKFETEAKETLSSTLPERISANPIVRTLTSAAEPILGAAALMEKPFGGTGNADRLKQLRGMQERGSKALGFSDMGGTAADIAGSVISPLGVGALKAPAAASALGRIGQNAGFGAASGVTSGSDEPLKDAAKGAGFGAGVGGAAEGIGKMAGRIMAPRLAAPTRSGGAGAEKAVNELQTQRGQLEGETPMRRTDARASAMEKAVATREQTTKPLRDAAFQSGARVDSAPVTALIDKLETANPDKKVRAALKEVRDVLENATTGSQSKALPPAGARVSPQQLKAMQGQVGQMDVAMADEVRQSIGRLIDQKGDKALDKHTQQLLGQLRDKLVEGTPQSYKQYLQEYSKLSKPIDEFKAGGSARTAVTGEADAFHLLTPKDKQNMIEDAFTSKTPGRSMKELVRDTAHNPEAAKGVRDSYADWLTVPKKGGGVPSRQQLLGKWQETRDAVRDSGLMTPDHIAIMDKVMDDVAKADSKGGVAKAWASTGGFIFGMGAGHPILAAHLARDVIGGKGEAVEKALDKAVMQILADPATAQLLAQPPTQQNINAAMKAIQPLMNTAIVADTKPDRPKRRNDVHSMSPDFGGIVQSMLGIGNAQAADEWKPTNSAGDVKVTSGSVIPQQGQTHYDDTEKAARLAQRKAKYDALPPAVKKTIGPFDPARM